MQFAHLQYYSMYETYNKITESIQRLVHCADEFVQEL